MRWAAVLSVLSMLIAAPAAGAAPPQPGFANGVRAISVHGNVTFVFTRSAGRLWKRVAGRELSVECDSVPAFTPGAEPDADASEGLRAPRRGRRLATGLRARAYDLCRIWIVRRGGDQTRVLAIALDQAGAKFLDEVRRAGVLLTILDTADELASGGHFPTAADVAAKFGGKLVALAAPTDTPPAGRYGFYSDRDRHITAVALSSAGRRLFLDLSADIFSTNVLPQINFSTD